MLRLRSRPRVRLAAIVTVFGTGFGTFEPAVGLLRDGEVHHEGTIQAAEHAAAQTGEHGHEHESESAPGRHGPGHQHGTGVDHCTHVHGTALVSGALDLIDPDDRAEPSQDELLTHSQLNPHRPFHPPRA